MSGTSSDVKTRLELELNPKDNQRLAKLMFKRHHNLTFAFAPGLGMDRGNLSKFIIKRFFENLESQGLNLVYSYWKTDRTSTYTYAGTPTTSQYTFYDIYVYGAREMLTVTAEDCVEPGRPLELIKELQLEKM